MKAIKISDNSGKTACSGKFWFLSYSQKSSLPMKLQESCFCNISLLNDGWKLKLGMLLRIQDIFMLNTKNLTGVVDSPSHAHFSVLTHFSSVDEEMELKFGQMFIIQAFITSKKKFFVWCSRHAQPRPFFLIFTFLLFVTMKIQFLPNFWEPFNVFKYFLDKHVVFSSV